MQQPHTTNAYTYEHTYTRAHTQAHSLSTHSLTYTQNRPNYKLIHTNNYNCAHTRAGKYTHKHTHTRASTRIRKCRLFR